MGGRYKIKTLRGGAMPQEKLWTKNFISMAAMTFLVYFIYYLLMVVIAVYSMEVLKATPSKAGLAAGIFMVAALLARLFTGRYIEQYGARILIYASLLLYAAILPLYFVIKDINLFCVIRFLHGLGMGVSTSAMAIVVVKEIPHSRLGEGLGYYALGGTLAMAIGPLFGMYLYHNYGLSMNLYLCMALAVIILVALFRIEISNEKADAKKLEEFGHGLSSYFEKSALPIAFIGTLMFFSYSSLTSFLAPFVARENLAEAGSFYFMFFAIAALVSRPPMGRLYDEHGNIVMYPAFLCFAAGMFVLGAANNSVALFVSGALLGCGDGTFCSLGRAIAVQGMPTHKYGLATSTFLAISEVGTGLGPFFLGMIIPLSGYRNLYHLMGVVALLAMVVFYWQYHNRKF